MASVANYIVQQCRNYVMAFNRYLWLQTMFTNWFCSKFHPPFLIHPILHHKEAPEIDVPLDKPCYFRIVHYEPTMLGIPHLWNPLCTMVPSSSKMVFKHLQHLQTPFISHQLVHYIHHKPPIITTN